MTSIHPDGGGLAADWAETGEDMAAVTLRADDRMLLVSQGDGYAAFDTGGEPGSDEYLAVAPLDPEDAEIEGLSPAGVRQVVLIAGMLRDQRLFPEDGMPDGSLELLDRAAAAWQEAVAAEACDDDGDKAGPYKADPARLGEPQQYTIVSLMNRLAEIVRPDTGVWCENAETGPGPVTEIIPGWGPDGQVMIR